MKQAFKFCGGATAACMMGAGAALIVMSFLTADIRAETDALDELMAIESPADIGNRFPINVTYVVDGDTFDAVVDLGWGVGLTSRVRCSDYDAWEKSKRRRAVEVTDEEVRRGKLATEFLTNHLKTHDAYLSPARNGDGRDNYGRILGRVYVRSGDDVESLATIMQRHGHLRREPGDNDECAIEPESTGWGGFTRSDFAL